MEYYFSEVFLMKKISLIAVLLVLFCGTTLSAKDFDWSECWCNYGGGVEQGDIIVNVGGGLYYSDFSYAANNDFWFIPQIIGHCVKMPMTGIYTFCFHPNTMNEQSFINLEKFLKEHILRQLKKIVNLIQFGTTCGKIRKICQI